MLNILAMTITFLCKSDDNIVINTYETNYVTDELNKVINNNVGQFDKYVF